MDTMTQNSEHRTQNFSVLCIGGLDPSGGAGLSADLKTLAMFGVHGFSIVTTVTAQNEKKFYSQTPCSVDEIKSQWHSIWAQHQPQVIKIGLIPNNEVLQTLFDLLQTVDSFIIFDPILATSSHFQFDLDIKLLQNFIAKVHLLTPNAIEFQKIFAMPFDLYRKNPSSQLIFHKGGHAEDPDYSVDTLLSQHINFSLYSPRIAKNFRGTGCTLASAIAACYAKNNDISEAVIEAKSFMNQCFSGTEPFLDYKAWPHKTASFPTLFKPQKPFLDCGNTPLATYPVVDSAEWVEKLIDYGIDTIQIRIKHLHGQELVHELLKAIKIARAKQCRLFVNDYWQLAIKLQAYGVHLGQEDLDRADIHAIRDAGLRLGISTHSFYEAARAKTLNPSYIALGPIYETTLKKMPFGPQGLERLKIWTHLFDCPVVAIGGLTPERGALCYQMGADSVAMVSGITQVPNLEKTIQEWKNIESLCTSSSLRRISK